MDDKTRQIEIDNEAFRLVNGDFSMREIAEIIVDLRVALKAAEAEYSETSPNLYATEIH